MYLLFGFDWGGQIVINEVNPIVLCYNDLIRSFIGNSSSSSSSSSLIIYNLCFCFLNRTWYKVLSLLVWITKRLFAQVQMHYTKYETVKRNFLEVLQRTFQVWKDLNFKRLFTYEICDVRIFSKFSKKLKFYKEFHFNTVDSKGIRGISRNLKNNNFFENVNLCTFEHLKTRNFVIHTSKSLFYH